MNQGIEKFNEIQAAISEMAEDIDKFYTKKNKAAGTRSRKILQKLKNLAQELRVDIQKVKNS